jgi:hypothetical protein
MRAGGRVPKCQRTGVVRSEPRSSNAESRAFTSYRRPAATQPTARAKIIFRSWEGTRMRAGL